MQAGKDRAADVPGDEPADRLSLRNVLTDMHARGERLIGGAQPAGMHHRDHSAAGQRAGVADRSARGGVDHFARRTGQVDPPMAGTVAGRRRIEAAGDPQRRRQRRSPAGADNR